MQQKIIILDFGSQTTQLIGRRVRELDTFCEIMPYNKFPKDDPSVIGVILSGSPFSVHDKEAFKVDLSQFVGRIPVLGICYGAQYISYAGGGKVEAADSREYGRANLEHFDAENPLFKGFVENSQVWMSHGDTITAIPTEAIVPEMGKDKVYLYKSGKAEPVDIITGIRTASEVQAIRGLHIGDTIITSGTLQLRTGLAVTLDNID
jgi:GMP synthase (glutamine-hydrolysing) A subunit